MFGGGSVPEETELEKLEKLIKPRQKKFIEHLDGEARGNATRAAIMAGYSEKSAAVTACRILKNANVAAYRRARARQIYEELGLTPETVTAKIIEIYDRCMDAEPHKTWDPDLHAYIPDGTWVFDARGAIRALELIGDSLGMFEKKMKVDANVLSLEKYLQGLEGGRSF